MLQDSGSSLWISALIMFVLLAVVFVVAKRNQGFGKKADKKLKVIERLVVGTNRTLMVVKAGEKVLLIGVTLQHMTLLAELDSAEWASVLKAQSSGQDGFSNILGNFINKSKMDGSKINLTGTWR